MAAMVALHRDDHWSRRSNASLQTPTSMGFTGIVPSFESLARPVSTSSLPAVSQPRTYGTSQLELPLFQTAPLTTTVPYQSGTYAFDAFSPSPYSLGQSYYPSAINESTHYQSHGVPPALQTQGVHRNTFLMINRHNTVKSENATTPIGPLEGYHGPHFVDTDYKPTISSGDQDDSNSGISFSTDVDTLMKTIQSQSNTVAHQTSERADDRDMAEPSKVFSRKPRRKYHCTIPGCPKSFYQKTHLEIHIRAHTGAKPFVCKHPGCEQRFSQLGNLKTHERRHTGERPYKCETCGKTFAQRGNVRAHRIVHQQVKPYTCRLDDCGKKFTQLGNLKSHQNKFHAQTLRHLAQRFSTIRDGDSVTREDRELWEYFSELYKHSNKGIKGRGKDRRISCPSFSSQAQQQIRHTLQQQSRFETPSANQDVTMKYGALSTHSFSASASISSRASSCSPDSAADAISVHSAYQQQTQPQKAQSPRQYVGSVSNPGILVQNHLPNPQQQRPYHYTRPAGPSPVYINSETFSDRKF